MRDIILALLLAAGTAFFYRARLKELALPPERKPLLLSAIFLVFAAVSAAAGYSPAGRDYSFMAPVMWLGAAALYEYCCEPEGFARYLLYMLPAALLFSVLILPVTPLTPYIFMPVLFAMMFISAGFYSSIMEKAGLRAALSFLFFAVFSVKYLIMGFLSPIISVPVSLCFAFYLAISKGKPTAYYYDERNAIKAMAPFYITLMAQCLVAAVLKNRIFF